MTHIGTKSVKREVYAPKWGDLIVSVSAAGISIREKGRRTWYGPVPFGAVMLVGARMKAESVKRDRVAAKKARRALREG
jgi:hypothetical protein